MTALLIVDPHHERTRTRTTCPYCNGAVYGTRPTWMQATRTTPMIYFGHVADCKACDLTYNVVQP